MMQLEYPFSAKTNQTVRPLRKVTGYPGFHTNGIKTKVRLGTGLIITVAHHDCLSLVQRTTIARFRLIQYVAAGLYDAKRAHLYEERGDPSMDALAPHDIHLAVGDTSGRFLAYLCMQSALPISLTSQLPISTDPSVRLRVWPRPQFPVETEYGDIYSRHPGIRALPIHTVREMSRLVRNQASALRRDPLVQLAIVETLLAATQAISDRSYHVEAIVGCGAPDARRALFALGIPTAYAPEAPVLGDNLGGASPNRPDELLWAPASQEEGRFWPFAIASSDLRADRTYYNALEATLAQPRPPMELLRLFKQTRRGEPQRPALYAAATALPSELQWIDQPTTNESDGFSGELPVVTPFQRSQNESA